MLGTLIRMYIFKSYPVLSFPVAFFLVRHLFYFLCCAMCLAWHWQINFHSLNFVISSCVNLTPQLQRTPVLFIYFFVCFSFFPLCTFFRRCQTIPPLGYSMLSVNNNHHLFRLLQGINDSITANVFSIYHSTWQDTALGAQTGRLHFCYCGYPYRKSLLGSTRAYLGTICPKLSTAWWVRQSWKDLDGVCRAANLFISSDPTQSLSEGALRVYSANSPWCLFFYSAHFLFHRRSRGDSVNTHQALSHNIKNWEF